MFTEVYYKKNGFTVYNVVKPVNQGIGYLKNVEKYYLENFGFYFIPGDPQLALFEDTLASDWSSALSGGERGIRTTLTFIDLIRRFKDFDYVIFDMGPSLGAINRSILLACDYFVTPEDGINDEYKRIIKENRNLEIITYNARNNHQELHDVLEELVFLVEEERTRIAEEMDW